MTTDQPESADADRADTPLPNPTGGSLLGRIPRLGVWSWSFVGFVVVTIIVVTVLAAVSEIVLPLTFAAVLAVVFKPLVGVLERHRFKPTIAAGVVVLGLLAVMTGVVVATVRGVTAQTDEIGASVDAALQKAVDLLGLDQASLDAAERQPRRRRRRSPVASSPRSSPASAHSSGWPAASSSAR